MLGLKAGIDGVSALNAAEEEPGRDERDHRQRNLSGEEQIAEGHAAAGTSGSARLLLNCVDDVGASGLYRRGESEQEAREERDRQGVQHHRAVHPDVDEILRNLGGSE